MASALIKGILISDDITLENDIFIFHNKDEDTYKADKCVFKKSGENIKDNFELALFIPLIAAMGGNVGVQSAAIVVQGLANESLKMENIPKKLMKELAVGLLNGLVCSTIILVSSFGLGYNIQLSLTVSISLFAVIVFAALFGTFIPLSLKRYNVDPALATGPFITTINDILGLFIYFCIGQAILL